MKTKWLILTLSSFLLLAVLGVAIFQGVEAQGLTVTQVTVEPKPLDLYNPDGVIFTIKVVDEYGVSVVSQIDPSSVVVEGWVEPYDTYVTRAPPDFVAKFDGSEIILACWRVITHMQLTPDNPWNPVKVPLMISGALNDGRTWEGMGYAKVYIGMSPPHH